MAAFWLLFARGSAGEWEFHIEEFEGSPGLCYVDMGIVGSTALYGRQQFMSTSRRATPIPGPWASILITL